MQCLTRTRLPTVYGTFEMFYYSCDDKYHLAIASGDYSSASLDKKTISKSNIIVRIHSSCITSEVFGSTRCDCAEQLQESLKVIGQKGGLIIYLNQEGRDIGLLNKLKAYNLIDSGLDTVEANLALGFKDDNRDYKVAAEMLKDLGVLDIMLMTNNPKKLLSMEEHGICGNLNI